jgi:hypothetical protein
VTPDILREVDAVGGRVWVDGGQVKYRLPADRLDLLDKLRSHKAEIAAALEGNPPLTPGDLEAVTKWLDAIKETDPGERARVLDKCRADPRALAYVLGELANLPRSPPPPPKSRPAPGLVLPFVRPRA